MTTDTALDMNAHYLCDGYRGIAWYLIGYATEWTEETWTWIGTDDDDPDDPCNYLYDEPEEVEDRSRVRAVMDRLHT